MKSKCTENKDHNIHYTGVTQLLAVEPIKKV